MTVSAQLLTVTNSIPSPEMISEGCVPSYDTAPENLLHRMLDLAPTLCSDDEITPVQAWNHIQRQPNFGGIAVKRVQVLAENMRKQVKCHG